MTMKTEGLMETRSPCTSHGMHWSGTVAPSDKRMILLIFFRFSPSRRDEPLRSSEQLPRPKIRRCCADAERYGLRTAMVLNWQLP